MVLIGASPNTQFADTRISLANLFTPWRWYRHQEVAKFESVLTKYFDADVITFDSGRSSLYAILASWGIGEGDQVILPAFICYVVANAVIATGATPIYVDIDEQYNLDLLDVQAKLTDSTKAVIAPHMFGYPINTPKLRTLVGNDIKIIEDIAHTLGQLYNGQPLGTFGDAAIASFGMDKMISTVRGGAVISRDQNLVRKLRQLQKKAPRTSIIKLIRILLHPIIWSIVTPTYTLGWKKFTIGKMLLGLSKLIGVSGNITIAPGESAGKWPSSIPSKLSGFQAQLGLSQFARLEQFNKHRIEISSIYQEALNPQQTISSLPFLRFPLTTNHKQTVLNISVQQDIQIGRWYDNVLFTPRINWDEYAYQEGSCPKTEDICPRIINLPTSQNIGKVQALNLIELLKDHVEI